MSATFIVGMLCVYLQCFALMFWLIGKRLQGNSLGMDVFALGNAMLGGAYVLQLLGGGPSWDALSVLNHTLTVCTPAVYGVGAMRFLAAPRPCSSLCSPWRWLMWQRRCWCSGCWVR